MKFIILIILLFILFTLILSSMQRFNNREFPKLKKYVLPIFILFICLNSIVLFLKFKGLALKGQYTFTILLTLLLVSSLTCFVLYKMSISKIIFAICTAFLLPTGVLYDFMTGTKKEFLLEEKLKIQVTNGGFMAMGEYIYITKTEYWLFNIENPYIHIVPFNAIKK